MKKLLILSFILVFVLISFPVQAANNVTGRTWILDTAGSITAAKVDIVWVIWTNITTDGDDLEVWDSPDTVLFKVKGKSGIDMIIPFPGNSGQLGAFNLKVIDSGTVQVRLGQDF